MAGAPLGEPSQVSHQPLSLSPWPWQPGWTLGTPRPSPPAHQPASSSVEATLAGSCLAGEAAPSLPLMRLLGRAGTASLRGKVLTGRALLGLLSSSRTLCFWAGAFLFSFFGLLLGLCQPRTFLPPYPPSCFSSCLPVCASVSFPLSLPLCLASNASFRDWPCI